MVSVKTMLDQIEGLIGTADVNEWESEFITSVTVKTKALNGDTSSLSGKQLAVIERIWKKHFAG